VAPPAPAQRRLEAAGRHGRVGIEPHQSLLRRGRLDLGDIVERMTVRHRSRALVDFSAGAKAGSFARYVRATIVLGPSRPKFACRIKMAHCKQQWNPQRLGNSCAKPATKRRE
jgi:hypothetical protein